MTRINKEKKSKPKIIKWLVLDVDGVLSDGTVFVGGDIEEIKGFNVKDGHGIKLWQRSGRGVAIITGRESKSVEKRAKELGIENFYQGAKKKGEVFLKFLDDVDAKPEEVCYVGDDLIDIPIFRKAGMAVAVADATEETIAEAHFVTGKNGGRGAVREVTDYLLKIQGNWGKVTERYFC